MEGWEYEKIFHKGSDYFDCVFNEIERAQKEIYFEVYIFEVDSLGKKILAQLKTAAERGVKVNLLIDGFGSLGFVNQIRTHLKDSKVNFSVYHPMPNLSLSSFLPWVSWKSLRPKRLLKVAARLNRRNHRKVCIIDSYSAFVGGINVTDKYIVKKHGHLPWRDSAALLRGKDVRLLKAAFDRAWKSSKPILTHSQQKTRFNFRKKIRTSPHSPLAIKSRKLSHLVQLNDTYRKRIQNHRIFIDRILKCETRIWITSPYFVPNFFLIRALRLAAWSGVDIRILLPQKNDVFFMRWVNQAFYQVLLRAGIKIFEYTPTTLHAKTVLIDDFASLGSSNQNHRSLFHDLEVDVFVNSPESIKSLESQFLKDLSHSKLMNYSQWQSRHLIKRYFEKILLSFKRWL